MFAVSFFISQEEIHMYDVVVIGAGVTGCAVARELSAYQLKTMVLEREEDEIGRAHV